MALRLYRHVRGFFNRKRYAINISKSMFQHTGRHIKHRPKTEGVTPLLFEWSAINGGVSTEKEIWWTGKADAKGVKCRYDFVRLVFLPLHSPFLPHHKISSLRMIHVSTHRTTHKASPYVLPWIWTGLRPDQIKPNSTAINGGVSTEKEIWWKF